MPHVAMYQIRNAVTKITRRQQGPFVRILVNSYALTLTQFILLLGNHQSAPVVRFVPCDTKMEEE